MKIKIKKAFKKAFTLAEILVTLSILGVVFAALAPTVNTFNEERAEKEYRAKTGKAYSVLSEALRAKFVATHQRMTGNSEASNIVNYITDGTLGTVKTVNKINGSGFKTQDGMVFAASGSNCHERACFIIVDLDGQNRGRTRNNLKTMASSLGAYSKASAKSAKDPKTGHSDIVVFMVKDGQVFPFTDYTAENLQMEKNTNTTFTTSNVSLQFNELNLSTD